MDTDGVLLVCGTQRNGRNNSTRLWIRLRAYMNDSSTKPIYSFFERLGVVVVVALASGLNAVCEQDWRHYWGGQPKL